MTTRTRPKSIRRRVWSSPDDTQTRPSSADDFCEWRRRVDYDDEPKRKNVATTPTRTATTVEKSPTRKGSAVSCIVGSALTVCVVWSTATTSTSRFFQRYVGAWVDDETISQDDFEMATIRGSRDRRYPPRVLNLHEVRRDSHHPTSLLFSIARLGNQYRYSNLIVRGGKQTVHHHAYADERLRNSEDYPTPERNAFLGFTNTTSATMRPDIENKYSALSDYRPMLAWQSASFPTCNSVHETNLRRSVLRGSVRSLGKGLFRDVWTLGDDSVVLKTLRYVQPVNDVNVDRHRRDAVAAERLTWSPRVLNIYAFCGTDGVFERGGETLVRAVVGEEASTLPLSRKLRIAAEAARAVADVHRPDLARPKSPTMAHTDVSGTQFLVSIQEHDDKNDGDEGWSVSFKLTDFNRARFLRWNERKNRTCGFTVGVNRGLFRAPEEYAHDLETEKVDVYALGNIFVQLYMGRYLPFPETPARKVPAMVLAGERPPINRNITNDIDPAHWAFVEAIDMAMEHDPAQRRSAEEIADFLEQRVKELAVTGENGG